MVSVERGTGRGIPAGHRWLATTPRQVPGLAAPTKLECKSHQRQRPPAAIAATHGCAPPRHPFRFFRPIAWSNPNPGRWPKKTEEDEKKDPRPSPLRVGESSSASLQLQRFSAAIAATHGCAAPRHPFSFLSAHCLVQSQPRQVAEKKDPRPSPLRVGESSSASLQRQRHPGGYSRHARVRSTLSPPFVSFGPLPWIRTNPGRWPKKTEEDEKNDPHPSRLRVGESSNASRQLQRTSAAIAATHRCTAPYHPLSFLSAHCLGSEPTQAGGRKKRKRTKKRPACFVPARGREFERFTSAATHLGGYSRHAPVHCALSPLFVSFGPLLGPNPNPGRWPKTAPIRYPMIWVY
jgi:hypothetical protein